MSAHPDSFQIGVDALARATATPADGRATRARILARANARLQRRAAGRRLALGTLIALAAALSGSVAWTAVGRWRAASAHADVPSAATPHARRLVAAADAVSAPPTPAASPNTASASMTGAGDFSAESHVYARAHEAHFVANDPHAALVAWNRYLATYPRGTFVLEARYNRALCLLRLGRSDEGVTALRPFADGAYGSYRRQEATTLIDWMGPQSVPGRDRAARP
jgi:TolA-binding protein